MRYALISTVQGKTMVRDFPASQWVEAIDAFHKAELTLACTRIELWDRKEFKSMGLKGRNAIDLAKGV